jgi:hypothetical protein
MQAIREWVHANLEVLGTLVPYLTTLVTIILACISYRAVVTGPRIQREISRDTIRANQDQIRANQDHQWVADFRQAMAEAIALSRHYMLTITKPLHPTPETVDDLVLIRRELDLSVAKIQLMVPRAPGDELENLFDELTPTEKPIDRYGSTQRGRLRVIMTLAQSLIEQREAGDLTHP